MADPVLMVYLWQLSARAAAARWFRRDERGEGVISAAIAVLIMAFLGVAVWVGFSTSLQKTQDKVDSKIEQIR